jgi:hypothetical protein
LPILPLLPIRARYAPFFYHGSMDDNRKEEEKKRPKPLTAEERERQEQEAYEEGQPQARHPGNRPNQVLGFLGRLNTAYRWFLHQSLDLTLLNSSPYR